MSYSILRKETYVDWKFYEFIQLNLYCVFHDCLFIHSVEQWRDYPLYECVVVSKIPTRIYFEPFSPLQDKYLGQLIVTHRYEFIVWYYCSVLVICIKIRIINVRDPQSQFSVRITTNKCELHNNII